MIKKLSVLTGCLLLILLCGCRIRDRHTTANEQPETLPSEDDSATTKPEPNPLLSDNNSLSNIAQSLDSEDNKKHAARIIEFLSLSGLPISNIVNAEITGENEYKCRYLLQITDSESRIYVVAMNADYSIIGIKKDSKDGDWVFIVEE